MPDLLQITQDIYAAFGRGDIPAILAHLDPEVAWESWAHNSAQEAGVPWLRARRGREGAAEFFQVVGTLRIHDFRVLDLMASGRQVAVEFTIHFTAPSGREVREEEMHLWTFNAQGHVTRFRHYLDTAKQIAAA